MIFTYFCAIFWPIAVLQRDRCVYLWEPPGGLRCAACDDFFHSFPMFFSPPPSEVRWRLMASWWRCTTATACRCSERSRGPTDVAVSCRFCILRSELTTLDDFQGIPFQRAVQRLLGWASVSSIHRGSPADETRRDQLHAWEFSKPNGGLFDVLVETWLELMTDFPASHVQEPQPKSLK